MTTKIAITTIEKEYMATRKKSQEIYGRAYKVIPSGVEHDGRYMKPFPFYVAKADGARKWDVDGNTLIDLISGHGGLLLGHNYPDVVAAIMEQVKRGLHYSSCHEALVEIAEILVELIPCAEKVRWVHSGTEASMLAIRLARAYSGKNKVIKFRGHFHGYWDEGMLGVRPPFDVSMSIGVPKEALSNVILVDHNDSEGVRRAIEEMNEVACVIMDPIGHGFIHTNRPGFLEEVRQITKETGVVLIFDEVMSALRPSPGGAQEAFGVTPDLTILSKTLGGGIPMAAVVGKKEIMDVLTFRDDRERDRFHRVISQGTHSATPILCAVALSTLKILRTGKPQAYLNKLGTTLRNGMNEVLQKNNIPGCVYGNFSIARIFIGHTCNQINKCDMVHCTFPDFEERDLGTLLKIRHPLYLAMLLNGVDYVAGLGNMLLNAALTEEDIEKIIQSFNNSLKRLKQEQIL
jgi:glutamate-1-semialdehyde 2,1-aminomutase